MWIVPKVVALSSGVGESDTELNALDNALLNAGVGNLNLVKVTSIFPPGATVLQVDDPLLAGELKHGRITPCVLASRTSMVDGAHVSASIGVGIPANPNSPGVIFEHACDNGADVAEERVRAMIDQAMRSRGQELREVLCRTASHTVRRIGCAVAVAILARMPEVQ